MKVTTYKDHTQNVYEEFDKVDKKSIDAIIRHGLNRMATFRYIGCDVHVADTTHDTYYYLGDDYPKTKAKWNEKMIKKLKRKLRMMHYLRKEPYSGYRYFGLTVEDYELWKQNQPIPNVVLYRVQRESEMAWMRPYQFKVKFEERKCWFVMQENCLLTEAEYIKELDIVYETTSGKYIQRRYDNGSNSISNTK